MCTTREVVRLWGLGLWFLIKWGVFLLIAVGGALGLIWALRVGFTRWSWFAWASWAFIGTMAVALVLTVAGMAEQADREARQRKEAAEEMEDHRG